MRALPNMTVLAPGDPRDAYDATAGPSATTAPSTCGWARTASPRRCRRAARSDPPCVLERGGDVVLLSTGPMLPEAVGAVELLAPAASTPGRPLRHRQAARRDRVLAAATCAPMVTVEEHTSSAAWAAPSPRCWPRPGTRARLRRVGLRDDLRPRGRLPRPPDPALRARRRRRSPTVGAALGSTDRKGSMTPYPRTRRRDTARGRAPRVRLPQVHRLAGAAARAVDPAAVAAARCCRCASCTPTTSS